MEDSRVNRNSGDPISDSAFCSNAREFGKEVEAGNAGSDAIRSEYAVRSESRVI